MQDLVIRVSDADIPSPAAPGGPCGCCPPTPAGVLACSAFCTHQGCDVNSRLAVMVFKLGK